MTSTRTAYEVVLDIRSLMHVTSPYFSLHPDVNPPMFIIECPTFKLHSNPAEPVSLLKTVSNSFSPDELLKTRYSMVLLWGEWDPSGVGHLSLLEVFDQLSEPSLRGRVILQNLCERGIF